MRSFYLFTLSFLICAFGQPAWIGFLAVLAASFGYALFWLSVAKKKSIFSYAFFWFFFAELIHLSWMSSIRYQGIFMLLVYILLSVALALQFAFFTKMVFRSDFKSFSILALASIWTLIEWSRVFFICGFTWNPIGLSLSYSSYAIQLAALFGIYGLSFYVMTTNLFSLKALILKKKSALGTWALLTVIPYLFGYGYIKVHESKKQKSLNTLLVQTALSPEEKEPFFDPSSFVPPLKQWELIFQSLGRERERSIDLIVFPEGALPFGSYMPLYSLNNLQHLWKKYFGDKGDKAFTSALSSIYSKPSYTLELSNAFIVQSLANYFQADVIIGLEDHEGKLLFNSAFHFAPNNFSPSRYDKRVLVPVGEYIPFEWCLSIARHFGINAFFTPGKEAKLFKGKKGLMATSICYEETYPHIIRQSGNLGAHLFVNISNDVWFPKSKLSKQHFDHGIIRAVENGLSIVRATNHGVTAAIDAFGRTIAKLPSPDNSGVLFAQVPLYNISTLYAFWGNIGIVLLSISILLLYFFRRLSLM